MPLFGSQRLPACVDVDKWHIRSYKCEKKHRQRERRKSGDGQAEKERERNSWMLMLWLFLLSPFQFSVSPRMRVCAFATSTFYRTSKIQSLACVCVAGTRLIFRFFMLMWFLFMLILFDGMLLTPWTLVSCPNSVHLIHLSIYEDTLLVLRAAQTIILCDESMVWQFAFQWTW